MLGSHAVPVLVWISSKGFWFKRLLWEIVAGNCVEGWGREDAQTGCSPDQPSLKQQQLLPRAATLSREVGNSELLCLVGEGCASLELWRQAEAIRWVQAGATTY